MRIADVVERLKDIANMAAESQEKALSLFATADSLVSWLDRQRKVHQLGGTFGEKFIGIRVRMEALAGLRSDLGDDRKMHAHFMRMDADVLLRGTLFGQRPDLLHEELLDENRP